MVKIITFKKNNQNEYTNTKMIWKFEEKKNEMKCQSSSKNKKNCAFLGSHANGILNSLLSHLNGSNNHQATATTTSAMAAPNYGRSSFYDDPSTTAKLEYQLRETEQLLEISLLKKKLRETERAMEQIIADIHGKAAKCNNDENNASNINMTTTQVRSSKEHTHYY